MPSSLRSTSARGRPAWSTALVDVGRGGGQHRPHRPADHEAEGASASRPAASARPARPRPTSGVNIAARRTAATGTPAAAAIAVEQDRVQGALAEVLEDQRPQERLLRRPSPARTASATGPARGRAEPGAGQPGDRLERRVDLASRSSDGVGGRRRQRRRAPRQPSPVRRCRGAPAEVASPRPRPRRRRPRRAAWRPRVGLGRAGPGRGDLRGGRATRSASSIGPFVPSTARTGAVAEPSRRLATVPDADAALERTWRPALALPGARRSCGPLRRGAGDPTYRRGPGRHRLAGHAARREGPARCGPRRCRAAGEVPRDAWGPGADWALDGLPGPARRRRRPDRLRAAAPRCSPRPGAGTRTGGCGAAAWSWSRWCPAIIEQKVTGQEAFAGFRRLVHRYGERAPGPGRTCGCWVQPDAATDCGRSRRGSGCGCTSTPPARAPSSAAARVADALERLVDVTARRGRPPAPHAPRHRGVDQRRGARRGRSATPTRSASATTTSPRTSAGR